MAASGGNGQRRVDLSSFDVWYEETRLGDAFEYQMRVNPRQLTAFAERLWPMLVAAMKADLAKASKVNAG